MPLSIERITGRREADAAISRAFGGKGAAVHSPSVDRPGIISTKTREGFDAALHQKSILNQNLPS
jgi:hypothetical protein